MDRSESGNDAGLLQRASSAMAGSRPRRLQGVHVQVPHARSKQTLRTRRLPPQPIGKTRRQCCVASKNADHVRATSSIWKGANKERLSALKRSYKARKRGAEGSHTGSDIQKLYALQRGKCVCCAVSLKSGYHVDHVMPLSLGGSNWPSNLQLLCPRCNLRKSAKHPSDFAHEIGRLF
jgi:5-methylcytosine-specific restriction endonuclease McrA